MTFLDVPVDDASAAAARYAILPVPYEGTVSYRTGTAAGPEAIIAASRQVEWFDEERRIDITASGICTLAAVEAADTPDEQMHRVAVAARAALRGTSEPGRFLLALGGEHSITAPLVREVQAARGPLSVLQIDAHADLRDTYSGTPHSHAAVMRRVLEITPHLCQVGVRAFSQGEYTACREQVDAIVRPEPGDDWIDRALAGLTDRVYVTIDIDGLDLSIAPGVGTPEPGGLSWQQITALLSRVCTEREVVAADIVEVCPLPGSAITEFTAARLACKLIAYTQTTAR